ncbi:hypothetical protein ACFLSA_05800 [Bacteroidota bacterium]
MKNLIIIVMCLISISLYANKKELPSPLRESFTQKYPEASDIKYKMQKEDYQVKFNNQGIKTISLFDGHGNWIQTVSVLKNDNIPI